MLATAPTLKVIPKAKTLDVKSAVNTPSMESVIVNFQKAIKPANAIT